METEIGQPTDQNGSTAADTRPQIYGNRTILDIEKGGGFDLPDTKNDDFAGIDDHRAHLTWTHETTSSPRYPTESSGSKTAIECISPPQKPTSDNLIKNRIIK